MSTGGPAFPVPEVLLQGGQVRPSDAAGMTLRDYFAAQALQSLIKTRANNAAMSPLDIVKEAFQYADMMIRTRG